MTTETRWDSGKTAAQSEAVDVLRTGGYEARLEDSQAGIWIEVRRPGEHLLLFLDGFWDAEGKASPGDMMALDCKFGRLEDGDLEAYSAFPVPEPGAVDWYDPRSVAACIERGILSREAR